MGSVLDGRHLYDEEYVITDEHGARTCAQCPDGGECTGNATSASVSAQNGWWRIPTSLESKPVLLQCRVQAVYPQQAMEPTKKDAESGTLDRCVGCVMKASS